MGIHILVIRCGEPYNGHTHPSNTFWRALVYGYTVPIFAILSVRKNRTCCHGSDWVDTLFRVEHPSHRRVCLKHPYKYRCAHSGATYHFTLNTRVVIINS